jgi:glycosyltransferase involved in cell wall biosynthesis
MNILHINDKIEISGGVETNIQQLCQFSCDYGIQTSWLGIYETEEYRLTWYEAAQEEQINLSLKQVFEYLTDTVQKNAVDIIHIHSLSNPAIIQHCFSLAKVVRSMHEPRMYCPGQGKFWLKTERICNQPFGLHCIIHAYKESCCNRHPKRLLKAYQNVKFETSKGRDCYQAIFAMSNYMIEEAKKVGFQKEQIVYNSYFTPYVEENELIDQSHQKVKHLIFIGRLSKTKGVHYFIDCGLDLIKKGYPIHLDIVGDGYDAAYFKNRVLAEYKKHFTFHGWQAREQIEHLFRKSYLLVFPSIYPEAFGISGIEAMMRAKPVVGFDVGGVSTWLKEGKTGNLVPVKDTLTMLNRIIALIEDKEKYQQFSKKAREIASEEFSVEKHMNILVNTYRKVLSHESR